MLTLGQRVIGLELARRLVRESLGYFFDPDTPSNEKVSVITGYELRDDQARARACFFSSYDPDPER